MKYNSEEYNKVINRSFKHFEGFFDYTVIDKVFLNNLDNESQKQLLKDVQDKWGEYDIETLEDLAERYSWNGPIIFLINTQTDICYIITVIHDSMEYTDSIILPIEDFVESINEALKIIHGLNNKSIESKEEEKEFL